MNESRDGRFRPPGSKVVGSKLNGSVSYEIEDYSRIVIIILVDRSEAAFIKRNHVN